ncbi:hypothetical protein D0T60_18830, partial [Bacteroides sp. 224]|nr:hypothetical protein [Bacteroides sp. 224]
TKTHRQQDPTLPLGYNIVSGKLSFEINKNRIEFFFYFLASAIFRGKREPWILRYVCGIFL